MPHLAPVDHPIHPLLRQRWSPRRFADREVDPTVLRSLFEAARWAPSSFNEQPWAFVVARRGDGEEHARLLESLVPGNREWAASAPVLALSFGKLRFARNEKENRHHLHDVGQAVAHLTFEAESRGLQVHQMAGIEPARIREIYAVPEAWVPVTAIAIGYPAEEAGELRPRRRRPLAELVFAGRFGEPSPLLDE